MEAQYTVKVDVNGKVAGYGLATTPKNGTPESKFIVNADRFGIGATGKADVFPFVVDTQKNRVGVNGELVVNGKAVVDNLNAGDIHGDKITANTLDANRLKAGSVTAREIGANSVTADKMNVTSLSAVSSNLGSITGGSLSIGNGKFSVTENGALTANDAVIRGRIEADSGYFNGLVKASRIEGDVMKVHRMRQVSENVWELTLPPDDLVRMIKVEILLNAEPAPAILEWSENARRHVYVPNSANPRTLRLTINNDVIEIKAEGIVTQPINKTTSSISTILVETVWITIPTGAVNIRLEHQKEGNRDNAYKVIKLLGGVTTSYLSPSDPEYKDLSGTKIWRVFKDSLTLRVHPNYKNRIGLPGTNRPILYAASLSLPNNIYGLSFEYRVDTNTSWATGIYWNYHPEARTIKEYSSRNHNGEFKLFTQELSTVSTMSSIDLIGEQDWQWVELRNIRVLIPESRKDEVW